MAEPALSAGEPADGDGSVQQQPRSRVRVSSRDRSGLCEVGRQPGHVGRGSTTICASERRADSDLGGKVAESTTGSTKLAAELGGPTAADGTLALVLAAAAPLRSSRYRLGRSHCTRTGCCGAVGLAGGLIGALTNWGMREDRIHQYEAGIRAGGVRRGAGTPRAWRCTGAGSGAGSPVAHSWWTRKPADARDAGKLFI